MTPEDAILDLLRARGEGKTICPSEAARRLAPQAWRTQMDTVRAAAARLAGQGKLVVTQKGQAVDLSSVRGPVRFGLP